MGFIATSSTVTVFHVQTCHCLNLSQLASRSTWSTEHFPTPPAPSNTTLSWQCKVISQNHERIIGNQSWLQRGKNHSPFISDTWLSLKVLPLVKRYTNFMAAKKPQDNLTWYLSFHFLMWWQSGWGTTANFALDLLLLCEVTVCDHHELHVFLASDCSGHVRDVALMPTLNWRKKEKVTDKREKY